MNKNDKPVWYMICTCTPGPLYNTLHYNMVLDVTLITVGPQLK